MEYSGIGEEYLYDQQLIASCKKIVDVHTVLARAIAEERNWIYREDPKPDTTVDKLPFSYVKPYGYRTCAHYVQECKLDNGDSMMCMLYERAEPAKGLRYDALIFHWDKSHSVCRVFVCPAYDPPKSGGYFEHSGGGWKVDSGCLYLYLYHTYADSDDIHDHDHYDTRSGACYDPAKHELRYFIPNHV